MNKNPTSSYFTDSTTLPHAIRWVFDRTPFLNTDDQIAFSDIPVITSGEFVHAKREILLALRRGKIKSCGVFTIPGDKDLETTERTCTNNSDWNHFINWCQRPGPTRPSHVSAGMGRSTVFFQKIPKELWVLDLIDWEKQELAYTDYANRRCWFESIEIESKGLPIAFPIEATTPSVATRKGRSAKYDWNSFYVEIALIADVDGLPATQAELERKMTDWCYRNNWDERLSETSIRNKIRPIYLDPRMVLK